MIYTSYFANHRNFGDLRPISIARYSPKWFECDSIVDTQFRNLAPDKKLLTDYKYNNLSSVDYAVRYINLIIDIKFNVMYETYENSVFLCYEKEGDFCHRHVLRFYMKRLGFNVQELEGKYNG